MLFKLELNETNSMISEERFSNRILKKKQRIIMFETSKMENVDNSSEKFF